MPDNQAYTDAGALFASRVAVALSGDFLAETAFSSVTADRKVNWAYTDAGALFVPRVAFAPSVFFQPKRHFSVSPPADRKDNQAYTDAGAFFLPHVALAPMLVRFCRTAGSFRPV